MVMSILAFVLLLPSFYVYGSRALGFNSTFVKAVTQNQFVLLDATRLTGLTVLLPMILYGINPKLRLHVTTSLGRYL